MTVDLSVRSKWPKITAIFCFVIVAATSFLNLLIQLYCYGFLSWIFDTFFEPFSLNKQEESYLKTHSVNLVFDKSQAKNYHEVYLFTSFEHRSHVMQRLGIFVYPLTLAVHVGIFIGLYFILNRFLRQKSALAQCSGILLLTISYVGVWFYLHSLVKEWP